MNMKPKGVWVKLCMKSGGVNHLLFGMRGINATVEEVFVKVMLFISKFPNYFEML